jgi:hypothetical protein
MNGVNLALLGNLGRFRTTSSQQLLRPKSIASTWLTKQSRTLL